MTDSARTRKSSLLRRATASHSSAARRAIVAPTAIASDRAAQARARRAHRARQLINPLGGASPSARGEPPVLVRGAVSPIPVRPRTARPPRRHYDVALNVPGAEIRLPALPAIRVGWRLLSGAIVLACLAVLANIIFSDNFTVTEIQVSGVRRLSAKEVNLVLGMSGDSIFTISEARIRQQLHTAFPELKDIRVQISLPAKVAVSAAERQPVLVWQDGHSEQWVDAEGYAFPPRGQVEGLIVVQANNTPRLQAGDLPTSTQQILAPAIVDTLLAMSRQAPPDTPLVFDAEHGVGWDDPHGWHVYFGLNLDDMPLKLKVYQALAEYLTGQGIEPEFISVEFPHAPYYRMEQ